MYHQTSSKFLQLLFESIKIKHFFFPMKMEENSWYFSKPFNWTLITVKNDLLKCQHFHHTFTITTNYTQLNFNKFIYSIWLWNKKQLINLLATNQNVFEILCNKIVFIFNMNLNFNFLSSWSFNELIQNKTLKHWHWK